MDKSRFFKFYKDVSQQLEACLDKLLCIKAQLADEDVDTDSDMCRSRPSSVQVSSRQRSRDEQLSPEERALIERIKVNWIC